LKQRQGTYERELVLFGGNATTWICTQ